MAKVLKSIFTLLILVSVPFSVYLIQQKTNFFGKAFAVKANLVIDVNSSLQNNNENWRNLAQGGEERGRQLLPVIDKTRALSPKYIRIDHVFDHYNRSELDLVLEDIKSIGAKPFISLSYMPPSISKNGNVEDLPSNWQDWEKLVQETIEHISGRNGLATSGVYYEVWNEPDLFGKFKTYGEKNYLDLYLHTAIGASRAKNVLPFKLGGPATTSFYENWMNKLVVFSKNNNLKLDFLSWHRYSLNLDDYYADIEGIGHFTGLETIISESGPNSQTNAVNDSYFAAIHAIAVAAISDGKIDKLFNFEIKDGPGPQKYWGRWGLLTNEKFGTPEIKPRYEAIRFLNNLNGSEKSIPVNGSGSYVKAMSREKDGKILILIVNYDKSGKNREAVPIKVINLKSNKFTLKRIDFNGQVTKQVIEANQNSYEALLAFEPNTASILEISY